MTLEAEDTRLVYYWTDELIFASQRMFEWLNAYALIRKHMRQQEADFNRWETIASARFEGQEAKKEKRET